MGLLSMLGLGGKSESVQNLLLKALLLLMLEPSANLEKDTSKGQKTFLWISLAQKYQKSKN